MTADLLKPVLYGTEDGDARPGLLGGACTCGHVFFPMQSFGCERCGSIDLKPRTLAGHGRLLASARVHLYAGKHREAPFTVGSIALEDGPIVRTLLVDDEKPFRVGDRLVTTFVEVRDAEGNPKRDLRFARAD